MFCGSRGVHVDHGYMITNFLELIVHQNCANLEAGSDIDRGDPLEKMTELRGLAVWCMFNRD